MKVGRYIPSDAERELQEENKDLRKQVEQLKVERDEHRDLYLEHLGRSTEYTLSSKHPAHIESKNYLRPTKLSESRRVDKQIAPSTATKKSLARRVKDEFETWCMNKDDTNVIDGKNLSDSLSDLEETLPESYTEEADLGSVCIHFNIPCAGNKLDPSNDLCDRTKLAASELYDTPHGRAYVRFDKVLKLLHAAHRLARDSTWHAFHTYWPEFQRKHFRYGPWQVRFGSREMADKLNGDFGIFARNRLPNVYNNVCDMPPDVVNRAILSMVGMRNLLAHPFQVSLEEADSFLQTAQELTCVLHDEHRAKQIRRLRDDLQELVNKALKEIVDYEPLSHLPGARHWALHHQFLFEEVITYIRAHNQSADGRTPPEKYYHPAVVGAAITWISRFQTSGANLRHSVAMPLAFGLPPEPPLGPGQASEEVIKGVQGIGKDEKREAEREAECHTVQ
ncbi:uncharacterized protein MYCFIDRAFT_83750 [Pseudocercospora fijiensis CIRAD86]|uniref:Uncharacterized protein n=1 Tax=Pseudocercospora fijiensis (strain CIRAD86) TaxID=383855 RepID=M3A2Y7_PSEFD|nr:uncharacterized protein MYCFIDRAFT_83750 [Pseudocercospora fijiensis CIRAD86]EME78911.1 hypothetical protein MYCFIDRAFT_83750 [Pseudocercospora fijiensis CIRAD86]